MRSERHGRSAWCLMVGLAAMVLAPAMADAQPEGDVPRTERAYRHLERGLSLYKSGRYREAIRELDAGYQVERWEQFLLHAGSMAAESGDCESARDYLSRYLESGPSEQRAQKAREGLERCASPATPSEEPDPAHDAASDPAAVNATQPTPRAPDAPADSTGSGSVGSPSTRSTEPAMPVAPSQPGRPDEDAAHWYHDPLGAVLVGTGIVSLGVATGFYLGSRSTLDSADRAEDLAYFKDRVSVARSRRTVAQIAAGAGAALIAAGAVRYTLRARQLAGLRVDVARDRIAIAWVLGF